TSSRDLVTKTLSTTSIEIQEYRSSYSKSILYRVAPRIVKSQGLDGDSCGDSSPASESRIKSKLKEPSAVRVTWPLISVRPTSFSWMRRDRRPKRSASTEIRPAYNSVSSRGSATRRLSSTIRLGKEITRRSNVISAPVVSFSDVTTR